MTFLRGVVRWGNVGLVRVRVQCEVPCSSGAEQGCVGAVVVCHIDCGRVITVVVGVCCQLVVAVRRSIRWIVCCVFR